MSSFKCTNPGYIVSYGYGTMLKKDKTLGTATRFYRPGVNDSRDRRDHVGIVPFVNDLTGEAAETFEVPCGKCFNCRRRKSFEWSTRLRMESSLYSSNEQIFLTLTYDNSKIVLNDPSGCGRPLSRPPIQDMQTDNGLSLCILHWQRFMDSLRGLCKGHELRFFMSGEYGKLGRPHFHAIIFGFDFFREARLADCASGSSPLFQNKILDKAWPLGLCVFGQVDTASIMYTAQYAMKKSLDDWPSDDPRKAPFISMSRKRAIGRDFAIKNYRQIFDSGGFYVDGSFVPVPRPFLDSIVRDTPVSVLDLDRVKRKAQRASDLRDQSWYRDHDSSLRLDSEIMLEQRELSRYSMQHKLKGDSL